MVYHFVEAEFRKEAAFENVDDLRQKLNDLETSLAKESRRLIELDGILEANRAELDGLKTAIAASPEGQLYLHLRDRNKAIVSELERIKQTGRTSEEAARGRSRNATRWLAMAANLPIQPDSKLLRCVEQAAATLATSTLSNIPDSVRALALATQDLHRAVDSETRSF